MLRLMLSIAFCSVILIHPCYADPGTEPQTGFEQSYESARERAASSQMPLLIHFQAFYCGPCRQMDSQVFSSSEVQSELSRGLVAVQIDVTQHPDLAGEFEASTVPRDVVVYPNGKTETLQIGFVPRTSYIAMLSRIRSEGDRIRIDLQTKPTPRNEPNEQSASGTPTPAEGTAEPIEESEEPLFLGLDGFCPVRLHNDRQWVRGQEELSDSYRGVKYYFATSESLQEFQKDPGRFAPKNFGCDPVVLLDSNRAITGKIQYGAFFDNQLFLFDNAENRTEFKKNPLKFTKIRHAIRIQDVEGTRIR